MLDGSKIINPPSFYARLIGVSVESITNWCRSGALKANRIPKNNRWAISISDFENFLYINPKFRVKMEKEILNPEEAIARNFILADLKTRTPRYYSRKEFSNMFFVTDRTIAYWVSELGLEAHSFPNSTEKFLFTMEDFIAFTIKNDAYSHYYVSYNNKVKGDQHES